MRADLALRCVSPLTSGLFSGEGAVVCFLNNRLPPQHFSHRHLLFISGTHLGGGMKLLSIQTLL